MNNDKYMSWLLLLMTVTAVYNTGYGILQIQMSLIEVIVFVCTDILLGCNLIYMVVPVSRKLLKRVVLKKTVTVCE